MCTEATRLEQFVHVANCIHYTHMYVHADKAKFSRMNVANYLLQCYSWCYAFEVVTLKDINVVR